ncbi:MAG: single-stranded-DNA-specific exonuclease RecJ [Chromatiaceae bacterium]|nr:MAG: single-stranded-DNA-specific exonuclease RecJ [Chromatiaceae bacterium]
MASASPAQSLPAAPTVAADNLLPVRIRRRGQEQGAVTSLDGLLARLYRNRATAAVSAGQAAMDPRAGGLADMLPVTALAGSDAAAALLADCIQAGGRILIVGDYDADGATGTAVGLLGLRALGAAQVDSLTPSRFSGGYGLSLAVVEAAAAQRPDLLVTVDNGIGNVAAVARCNALGIPVLITDHHLPGADLPPAAAIVNPNQPGCAFPSKHLAGVGVMFYVLIAARTLLRRRGWFRPGRPEPNLAALLDLVALGTVADVVTLDRNNRILVEQGLRRIRAGQCRHGLRALLEIAGCQVQRVTARDLGFAAGPRLNAAGRLTDMGLGIACLTTETPLEAMCLARQLDALNAERRALEAGIRDQAEAIIAGLSLDGAGLPAGLCLYDPDWHQGVVGIVAARLRERYQRPAIVFARAEDGLLRGSARSVDGLHLRDCIDAVARAQPGLIERYGGHAMAAGLTLPPAHLDAFRDAFASAVRAVLGAEPAARELWSDGELPGALMTLSTAEALRLAGPWGKGFAEPLFDGPFAVSAVRVVAERHLRFRARAPGGPPLEAIGFNLAAHRSGLGGCRQLVYRLDVNEYRGLRNPQLRIEHIDPVSTAPDPRPSTLDPRPLSPES